MKNTWNQSEAVSLCVEIEKICPQFGCHVALTGGCLYRDGEREDCDILFYRIRQVDRIDIDKLLDALAAIGLTVNDGCGFVYKARYEGRPVDIFFPEEEGGPEYGEDVDQIEEPLVIPAP